MTRNSTMRSRHGRRMDRRSRSVRCLRAAIEPSPLNPDGSNLVKLTDGFYDYFPAWSPDGSKIAFWRAYDVYVMNADGSNLTRVTTDRPASGDIIAWAPDGTKILFCHDSQVQQFIGYQIYAISVDGTSRQNLSNNNFDDC